MAATIGLKGGTGSSASLQVNGTDVVFLDSTGITQGAPASFRNKIINGDMRVDQRNNGAAQTIVTASFPYTVDRFIVTTTGANITSQRSIGTGAFQYDLVLTGAASVSACGIRQRIESVQAVLLKNQDCSFSVQLASSSLTSATWTAYYANSTDVFTTQTQIATGTFTISSTPTIYKANFNAGANAGNGICIVVSFGALGATQTIRTSGWQLEAGTIATAFEQRPLGLETLLCQRYYYRIWPSNSNSIFGMACNNATTQCLLQIKLPTNMRIAPSSIEQTGTTTDYRVYHAGSFIALSSIPTYNTGSSSLIQISILVAAGLTASGSSVIYNHASTTNAYIGIPAEL